jgi:hypothetical protein
VSDPDCPFCHGEELAPGEGPDGKLWPRVCGVCTPLPESVLAELADHDEDDDEA